MVSCPSDEAELFEVVDSVARGAAIFALLPRTLPSFGGTDHAESSQDGIRRSTMAF